MLRYELLRRVSWQHLYKVPLFHNVGGDKQHAQVEGWIHWVYLSCSTTLVATTLVPAKLGRPEQYPSGLSTPCSRLLVPSWKGGRHIPQTAPVRAQSIVVEGFWIWSPADVSLQLISQSGGKKVCPASRQKWLDFFGVLFSSRSRPGTPLIFRPPECWFCLEHVE